ncbi:MAG TPA: hypothetical protein VG106_15205, partial [Vicinamibacterales bacterium]|nr:hypothetical protein [Vicinamibacterales bacterium]
AILVCLTALPLVAGRRTHIVNTTDRTRLEIVRESSGDSYATFERDGVRYITRDRQVLGDLEDAFAEQRAISEEHAALGRRHAALGREHAEIGREHARIGREHARLHRAGDVETREERERELEELQRRLERKQDELERKQQELEREQRELERRQKAIDRESDKTIEKIFERAIRDGKATRD